MTNSLYTPTRFSGACWEPALNPSSYINSMEDLLKTYQREESNDDQSRCWGMIKDLFLYRVSKLVKENLFNDRKVKLIGDDLVARSEALFSIKEHAAGNCEKISFAFNNIFGINVEGNHETSIIDPDYIAPDGSQIFLISNHIGYGLARCVLPQNATSIPARHKTVAEIWTIESGNLELYLKNRDQESTSLLAADDQREIHPDTHFQFRTIGEDPVSVLIRTFPVWPGAGEVVDAQGPWAPTVHK